MDKFQKFGLVTKSATTEDEMAQINRLALAPLSAEDVYAFKVAACDDQVDREYERFTELCLRQLAKMFTGKPLILDHNWTAKGITGRVYAAAVERGEDGVNRLILRVYMLKNENTAPVVAAIEGGVLREVSVAALVDRAVCSICGTDKCERYCEHRPGQSYDGKQCVVELSEATDAYEVSFCAVPAQPEAGVCKQYGGEDEGRKPQAPRNAAKVKRALALLELERSRY